MSFFSLIFNNQEYKIPKKKHIICAVAEVVANQLLENNKYNVNSTVKEETFQSFLNYWQNRKHQIFSYLILMNMKN